MGKQSTKVLNSGLTESSSDSAGNGSRSLRFGLFELDLRTGELRRNGTRTKLQEQPFQVLAQLLEKPGDVVTREELRDRLWPADTFVDFDHSLNAAIRRLRDALGDSAENPTFVETVARRGYRFLAPVTTGSASALEIVPAPAEPAASPALRLHPWWIAGAVAAIVLVLVGLKLGLLLGRDHLPPPVHITQLTANPEDDRVRAAAISRDGKYLAFADETGFYLRQIDSGETHPLALPAGLKAAAISWFPDGMHMVMALATPAQDSSLWEISTLGGSARKLFDDGGAPAVSPDGKQVAFVKGKHINQQVWLVDADGGQPRQLAGQDGDFFGALAWSPDGSKLAYTRGKSGYGYAVAGGIEMIEIPSQRVSSASVHVTSWMFSGLDGPLAWSPDGHLIYTVAEAPPRPPDSNLWSVAINSQGQRTGAPVRLTSDTGTVRSISTTADGKRLAYVKGIPQPDVYVARLEARGGITEPQRLTLDDRQDIPFDWTADSKEVIFISDRTGRFSVYKQALDSTVPDLLVRGTEPLIQARMSPDGTQLMYLTYPEWGSKKTASPLMRVPLAGGTPQKILEASWVGNHQCSRAPATVCLYSIVGDGKLTFFAFDPLVGKGTQVYQIPAEQPQLFNWSLSPDGTRLAIVKGKWGDEEPRIHIVPLNGGADHWITIQGWPGLASLDWAADGNSLWAPTTGEEENTLLNIDLQGHARAIWRPTKKSVGWAIPSRDGRHLALYIGSSSANVWMLEHN
jgi:Tol biopolymer transport system component/DNA-binding winged helix-turn-helix (wHTH) protein